MLTSNIDLLTRIAETLTDGKHLTPSEAAETLRILQGYACKDSAAAIGVSPETIRARRKRIYRKLGVPGALEVLAAALDASLCMLEAALVSTRETSASSSSVAATP